MLARVVNRWTYKGVTFEKDTLVEMPEELVSHLFETSTVEEIKDKRVLKIFDAATQKDFSPESIKEEVREKINFVDAADEYAFKLEHDVDGEVRSFQYKIRKDRKEQVLD